MSTKFPEPITAIIGPPGSGKTFLAGTLVPEFRVAVRAKKPHSPTVKVGDVWWLQFDRAGADTLRQFGVEPSIKDVSVPPTSLVDLFADKSSGAVLADLRDVRIMWLRRVNQIVQELKKEALAGNCRLLVADSMTAFTRMVTDAFIAGNLVAQASDKFNLQQHYGFANLAIGQILSTLRSIPVAQVWLMHARSTYTENTAEKLEDGARRPIAHTMEIDVQRGVQGALEPVPSMILGAKAESDQKGSVSYHLVTRPDGVFPIKNRWAAVMPSGTTPDLQPIWDAILAAQVDGQKIA